MFAKRVKLWMAVIGISLLWLLPSLAAEAQETVSIDILTINDFHGALSESGKNPGMAKVAACLRQELAKNPDGTILVSAGDMFQGTPESNMLYGKPVVEAMNELGFTAMALGNHEFDWGTRILKEQMAQSKFPYLAANLLDKVSGQTAGFIQPYTMVEKNGIKIAIIGLATPETANKSNPKYMENFKFANPAQMVTKLMPELKQQGADIVIVVSHLGSQMDSASQQITGEAADLAYAADGIAAIVSGHTHQKVAGYVKNVPIVQAAYSGRAIGKISLTISPEDNQVIAAESRVIAVDGGTLTPDPAVQAIVDQAQQEVAPVKNKLLGKAAYELPHEKFTQSLLGQWVTDCMRRKVKADIAFENGGGLRTSIPAGPITLGNLYQVVPFDNTLVTAELTGKQIMEILAHGIDNKQIGMLQFAGLIVEYDASRPVGQKIVKVTLADGRSLRLTEHYKVVTNDFMAQGGDGFTMFGNQLIDTQIPLRDCLIEAIQQQKIIKPVWDQRFKKILPASLANKPAA